MKRIFFFFSSRRRHTRLQGDWSSDVCSSDLPRTRGEISRTSGGDEPCPAVGAPRQARPCPRRAHAYLRLVHRGLRHRQSEKRKGAVERVGMSPWIWPVKTSITFPKYRTYAVGRCNQAALLIL